MEKNISTPFNQGFALTIGVGSDLPVTINDAKGFTQILLDKQRCSYLNENVICLTGEQATREGILCGLNQLSEKVSTNLASTVVVYFSGHGGYVNNEGYYLVPYNFDFRDISNTAIRADEFTQKLIDIKAKRLLVLLDCCHAGGMTQIKSYNFKSIPFPSDFENVLSSGSGSVLIASSRKDEVSFASEPYSIFTQALREALAGYGSADKNGYVYIADIAMYVGRVVPNRTNNQQNPILKISQADNFAIAYYSAGIKDIKPLPDSNYDPLSVVTNSSDFSEGYRRILRKYYEHLITIEGQMALFIDQATIPLDLKRTKQGILDKISEIEEKLKVL